MPGKINREYSLSNWRQSGPPKDYRKWKSGKTRWLFLVALLSSLENKKGTLDRDYQRGVFNGRFLDQRRHS